MARKRSKQAAKNKAGRFDSNFTNALIGSGLLTKDPMAYTKFRASNFIPDQELINMYISIRMLQKIVDLPVNEATKNWLESDEKVVEALSSLNAEEKITNALRWSRLFGGSAILMLINDGGALEEPVNTNNIKGIEELRVYDKRELNLYTQDVERVPFKKDYNKPRTIQIIPAEGSMFYVHRSRVLIFDGEPLPNQERAGRSGWGMSAVQNLITSITDNDEIYRLARLILERVSQSVTKLDGLTEVLTMPDGQEQVQARLQVIDMARSIMNTIAIDQNDDFQLFNMNLGGIPAILDEFAIKLSAEAGIPMTVLFGRSPAGQNSTGEADLEIYYSMVKQLQKRKLSNNLRKLIQYLSVPLKVDPWFDFKPLKITSEKEQAETLKIKADAAEKFVKINAISGAEVREGLKEFYDIDDELDSLGE